MIFFSPPSSVFSSTLQDIYVVRQLSYRWIKVGAKQKTIMQRTQHQNVQLTFDKELNIKRVIQNLDLEHVFF
jgi:hypothetical protein